MKNKNLKLRVFLIGLIVILLLIYIGIIFHNRINELEKVGQEINMEILGNKNDLVSFSIEPGQEVSGVLAATGAVSGGYFFEANIQVNILDLNKKVLRTGNGNAKTEWMTSGPVGFDTILDFTKLRKGKAYIEIHNDNASGLPENDKSILVPIIIN